MAQGILWKQQLKECHIYSEIEWVNEVQNIKDNSRDDAKIDGKNYIVYKKVDPVFNLL